MIIEPHRQPPPSKPTSYREYRRLKEEAEKKRREFEERLRKEEKARQEAEEKAREALEEKEKVKEAEQERVAEPVKADSNVVVSKASESKQVTSSSKPKEFKDPRRRKMMEEKEKKSSKVQEISEEPPSKPPETMKSFKIPKVKKIEKLETQSKLTEVDLFQSTEKVKSVKVAEDKSSGDKAAKVKEVVQESDADVGVHHHGDTDSDSEPSLQIAEDSEERERRRSSASESDSEVKQDARKRRKLSVEKEKIKEDEVYNMQIQERLNNLLAMPERNEDGKTMDEILDEVDEEIAKRQEKHKKEMEKVGRDMELLEQERRDREARYVVNAGHRDRLAAEITQPVLRRMFDDNLEFLKSIRDGRTESSRHTAFHKNPMTRQALLYTLITHPFTDAQVDWTLECMTEVWMKTRKEQADNNEYIWKVLIPECFIKFYMDFFKIPKIEAEKRIKETPLADDEDSNSGTSDEEN